MRDPRLWLFHRLFALCLLIAWGSLGAQILLLVGERGLLSFAPVLDRIAELELGLWQLPSVFRWGASDSVLVGGCWVGAGFALLALWGVLPRLMFLLSVVLYVSYAEIAGTFLAFQWDNLLIEAGLLAAVASLSCPTLPVLPGDPRGRALRVLGRISGGAWGVLLLRVLLFKLYFESGLAKLESPAGDWLDGSAMIAYYETAPLPGPLAWHAHALPAWFHRLESWATLGFELLVPLLIFGPRRGRWFAFYVLTAFQLFNVATANYGFFSYLSLALHVVLFDDSDLRGLGAKLWRTRAGSILLVLRNGYERRIARGWRWATQRVASSVEGWRLRYQVHNAGVVTFCTVYGLVSLHQGVQQFVNPQFRIWGLASLDEVVSHLRLVNTYHLFAQITLERVEPTFSVESEGRWTELSLRYKPGPVERALPLVAPHQPRIDFSLWFYGLRFRGNPPNYVRALSYRLCHDPSEVAQLFVEPLPDQIDHVRVSFWQYHFTDSVERERSGHVWRRQELGSERTVACAAKP